MDFEVLIPITLFVCVTYAIKALLDARTRAKLIASNGSEELIRSLVQNEEQQRRHASVRWGVVLVCLAIGFALIEYFGWDDVTPGAILRARLISSSLVRRGYSRISEKYRESTELRSFWVDSIGVPRRGRSGRSRHPDAKPHNCSTCGLTWV